MRNDDMDGATPSPAELRAMLRISCADAGLLLSDYRDGELAPDDVARIDAHLAGCVACGVILDQLNLTVAILGEYAPDNRATDVAEVDRVLDLALRG